jgi:hypothetical protein
MIARAACLACLLLVVACGRSDTRQGRSGPLDPPAFWVWHRSSPLGATEIASLAGSGVRTLYWQSAECAWDGSWRMTRIAAPMTGTADLEIVPVFRIKPLPAFLGSPDAPRQLAELVRRWLDGSPSPREIQLDFDCPDRLLGEYTVFLKSFAAAVSPSRVSITALAAWPRHPGFDALADSVSSLAPMFYDLAADAPADVKAGRFQPMADAAVVDLIRAWSACPRPWRAGLPNFERLSVFEETGDLTGHLRGWEHDPVFFHPDLKAGPRNDGVTVFEPAADVDVAGTRISAGSVLVHRAPDPAALAALAQAADESGAKGILYFALPGPGIQAAFSAEHLCSGPASPTATLEIDGKGRVVLKNPGPRDLAAGLWELELHSAKAGLFRSASPGGFAEAEVPGGVPAELANILILRFSRLRTGEAIVSGSVVTDSSPLSWRIRGRGENQAVISTNSAR